MTTRYFGEPIRRNEDPRLLRGEALFVDDVQLPGMLHVAFVRSDFAHGRVNSIDVSGALDVAGVVAAYTAGDLGDLWRPGPLLVPPPPTIERLTFNERTQVPLAKDKVRHVGEPLAVVLAESRYAAEDGVGRIFADIEPIDAVVDLESALAPGAPLVHDDLGTNLMAHVIQEKGDYAAVRDSADLLIARRLHYDRGTAAAMENRGVVADWEPRGRLLRVWDTTQAPIPLRNGLAAMFDLGQSEVQVIAPFIGGGFGPKIMMFYPEEVIVTWLALKLARPVKWIEDRRENFFATTQERGQIHDAEFAFDKDGRIVGVHDVFMHDAGAYAPYPLTVPINSSCTLLGPYRVLNYYTEFKAAFTNKPIVTPYRGAGRQHGVFVMERMLDLAARELQLDPVEIRRRNFLVPEEFPHHHEIIFQDFKPLIYDSGDYEPALDKAVEMIGYREFRAARAAARDGDGDGDEKRAADDPSADGRLRGIGVVAYVEGTGIGPYEGARVSIEPSGRVNLATGIGTQGQGHQTSFAQIVADQLGVHPSDVRVVTGDTREFGWGTGTFASRGAVVAGNACQTAAEAVRAKVLELAAEELEVAQDDLVLEGGKVFAKGAPQISIELGELAVKANPLRGAVRHGTEPGLEATSYFGPESGTTASGVHAMIVAVDPETFMVEIERYVVVHDCGRVINPLILEGQIVGGVAQGIGNAFYEQLVFDDQGQLLCPSFMDYLLPTATDVPRIETAHHETPSPLNPLGIKGAGEAGAIPVAALFAQALEDALGLEGFELLEIPLSPNRLFELVTAHRGGGQAGDGSAPENHPANGDTPVPEKYPPNGDTP